MFAADQRALGYVANFTRLFALRPAVYQAWRQLSKAVRANMDPREYELATLAAARALRSSYCALAHGKVLRDHFYDADTIAGLVTDHRRAGLGQADAAVMDFAGKVAADAASVTAAARCFFSTVLEAMGTEPDAAYRAELEPGLHQALTIGRPIAPLPAG